MISGDKSSQFINIYKKGANHNLINSCQRGTCFIYSIRSHTCGKIDTTEISEVLRSLFQKEKMRMIPISKFRNFWRDFSKHFSLCRSANHWEVHKHYSKRIFTILNLNNMQSRFTGQKYKEKKWCAATNGLCLKRWTNFVRSQCHNAICGFNTEARVSTISQC